MLFFVVSWKEIDWDTDQFVKKCWFFRYIHSHGWSTSQCPIIALSSGIERRARAPSFPLLRILIGSWQLPQRAARSARSWSKCSKLLYEQILWFTVIRSIVPRKTRASMGMIGKVHGCPCRVSSRQWHLKRHATHSYSLGWLSYDPCLSSASPCLSNGTKRDWWYRMSKHWLDPVHIVITERAIRSLDIFPLFTVLSPSFSGIERK